MLCLDVPPCLVSFDKASGGLGYRLGRFGGPTENFRNFLSEKKRKNIRFLNRLFSFPFG